MNQLVVRWMILLLSASWSLAAVDVSSIGGIAIQHDGRIKPLDAFARATLLQLNARSSIETRDDYGKKGEKVAALTWMAAVLFAPETTRDYLCFRINNPHTADALGLERAEKFRYSFAQLEPTLPKLSELAREASREEPEQQDAVDKELIRVFNNVMAYLTLAESLHFLAPNDAFQAPSDDVVELLDLPRGRQSYSFYEVLTTAPKLAAALKDVDISAPAEMDQATTELFGLARGLQHIHQQLGQSVGPFTIIPVAAEAWRPPHAEFFGSEDRPILAGLHALRHAYLGADQAAFDAAAEGLRTVLDTQLAPDDPDARYRKTIGVEQAYLRLDPFHRGKFYYLFSVLALAVGALFLRKPMYLLSWLLMLVAGGMNLAGMGMRMYITSRPPITNLYETFIFVGAVSFLLGILLELWTRRGMGLLIGGISALCMLAISGKFGMDGDTMTVLQAVLDSNFWLATHVVTINLGYAGCCVAGVIGHLYLLQRLRYCLRRKADRPDFTSEERAALTQTYAMIFGVLAFGTIFTFVGTVLGGIWADQSWGRFWGWDPKENGALLILLWCAALLHAKIARMIGQVGMAAGAILGIVVVMMAWFGINLLGVGLHSYGFTSGVLRNLIAYCALEGFFLVTVVPLVWNLDRYADRRLAEQMAAARTSGKNEVRGT